MKFVDDKMAVEMFLNAKIGSRENGGRAADDKVGYARNRTLSALKKYGGKDGVMSFNGLMALVKGKSKVLYREGLLELIKMGEFGVIGRNNNGNLMIAAKEGGKKEEFGLIKKK